MTTEIEALNKALEEAEEAYAAADLAMSDTLTAKIAAAETTLNAAIAAVNQKLDDAKTALENEIKADNDTVAAEIEALKDTVTTEIESLKNTVIAMIVIVSVVCGAGLVTILILVKKIKLLTSAFKGVAAVAQGVEMLSTSAESKVAPSEDENSSTEN